MSINVGYIGSEAFSFMNTQGLAFAANIVEDIERRGMPGAAFWFDGYKAPQSVIHTTTKFTSNSALGAKKLTYRDMQGFVWDIVDPLGNTYLNFLVRSCRPINETPVVCATDGVTTFLLDMEWILEHIQVA